MSHTPGPWKIDRYGNVEAEEGGESIADVRLWNGPANLMNGRDLPESIANGYLIAAAPAMKEALEEILDYSAISDSLDVDLEKYRKGTSGYHPNVLRALHKAKQALTLANGEDKEP